MSQLEFVGTKVPSEWIPKLKRLTEETGKTQSAIVRDAIAAALGVNVVNPVNPLREELDDLKARVQALEELTQLSMVNQKQETEVNRVKPIAPTSPDAPPNTTPPPIAVTKKAPDAPAPDGAPTSPNTTPSPIAVTKKAPDAPPIAAVTKKAPTSPVPAAPTSPPIAVATKPTSSKFMRKGELLVALKAKGYTRSRSSLERALDRLIESGEMPDELSLFGVTANLELRRSANPRNGSLRWLSIAP